MGKAWQDTGKDKGWLARGWGLALWARQNVAKPFHQPRLSACQQNPGRFFFCPQVASVANDKMVDGEWWILFFTLGPFPMARELMSSGLVGSLPFSMYPARVSSESPL